MPHRQEQLESALRRTIGQILLTGMSDPRIKGMISVTAVKVSPDRREAVVSISVLPAEHQPLTVTALDHAARHIQAEISKRIEIRQMPHLHFKADDSLKKQAA
ncbi:MAG: 30S ribosome-binding factor RbfA, partial [Phycisphaeraceae bacterium]